MKFFVLAVFGVVFPLAAEAEVLWGYERQVTVDLPACQKRWQKDSSYMASCEVPTLPGQHGFIWNSGRILHHWEYADYEGWLDVSLYHTDKGYRITLLSPNLTPQYFEFGVAKKYIQSALKQWGKNKFSQKILREGATAQAGETPLGRVQLIERKIHLRDPAVLDQCQKAFRSGQCFLDVIHGTGQDVLLEKEDLVFVKGPISALSSGFLGWFQGSSLSDYKIWLGHEDKNMSYQAFRDQWLKVAPPKTVTLFVQSFERFGPRPYFQDKIKGFARLEKSSVTLDVNLCEETSKTDFVTQWTCSVNGSFYPLSFGPVLDKTVSHQGKRHRVSVFLSQRRFQVSVEGPSPSLQILAKWPLEVDLLSLAL